jgi:hypothetical protein
MPLWLTRPTDKKSRRMSGAILKEINGPSAWQLAFPYLAQSLKLSAYCLVALDRGIYVFPCDADPCRFLQVYDLKVIQARREIRHRNLK